MKYINSVFLIPLDCEIKAIHLKKTKVDNLPVFTEFLLKYLA